jgi:hypothetical protein
VCNLSELAAGSQGSKRERRFSSRSKHNRHVPRKVLHHAPNQRVNLGGLDNVVVIEHDRQFPAKVSEGIHERIRDQSRRWALGELQKSKKIQAEVGVDRPDGCNQRTQEAGEVAVVRIQGQPGEGAFQGAEPCSEKGCLAISSRGRDEDERRQCRLLQSRDEGITRNQVRR